jgi:drug/metabolite transporter (DMT)-like permease
MMGLVCVVGAALCYGVASILQAVAAREAPASVALDPALLVRLAGSAWYVVGVGIDGAGFFLTLVATRSLPLFVVQSVVAGFLAVTAILGAIFLGMPLNARDRFALTLVLGGLVLVGLSATTGHPPRVSTGVQWALLGAAGLLVGVGGLVGRMSGPRGAFALGGLAGLAFGATSVGARMLHPGPSWSVPAAWAVRIALQPAAWGIVVAGGLGMLLYATALQRGSVTQATAPLVVGEMVVPALVGLWLLGDAARPGWNWVAGTGFVLSLAGAIGLAWHGGASPKLSAEPGAERVR